MRTKNESTSKTQRGRRRSRSSPPPVRTVRVKHEEGSPASGDGGREGAAAEAPLCEFFKGQDVWATDGAKGYPHAAKVIDPTPKEVVTYKDDGDEDKDGDGGAGKAGGGPGMSSSHKAILIKWSTCKRPEMVEVERVTPMYLDDTAKRNGRRSRRAAAKPDFYSEQPPATKKCGRRATSRGAAVKSEDGNVGVKSEEDAAVDGPSGAHSPSSSSTSSDRRQVSTHPWSELSCRPTIDLDDVTLEYALSDEEFGIHQSRPFRMNGVVHD